jgi:hypothetical protein
MTRLPIEESMPISSRAQLLALVGLLAAATLAGAYFFVLRPGDSGAAAQPMPKLTRPQPNDLGQRRGKQREQPPVQPAAVPAPPGLAAPVARALKRHPVVVVSLYASNAPLDGLARAESSAGARDARAGFVALNVLKTKQVEALALETGIVEAPSTLVYRRPGRLVAHLGGYADRVAVAQAATDARR